MSAIGRDGTNYGVGQSSASTSKKSKGIKCYTKASGKILSMVDSQKAFQTKVYGGHTKWITRMSAIRWINSNLSVFGQKEPLPSDTRAKIVKRIFEQPYISKKTPVPSPMDEKVFLQQLGAQYSNMTLATPRVDYKIVISALTPEERDREPDEKIYHQNCLVTFASELRLETNPNNIPKRLEKNKIAAEMQQNLLKDFAILLSTTPSHETLLEKQQDLINLPENTASKGDFTLFSKFHKKRDGYYDTYLNSAVGAASHVGERSRQEDSHIACDFEAAGLKIRLTGVFDGHGNPAMSQFISQNLSQQLTDRIEEFTALYPRELAIYNALKIAPFDLAMRFHEEYPKNDCGATATFQLQIDGHLWTHNIGDSRTLYLFSDENDEMVICQKSEDMKMVEKYTKGVIKRGGSIIGERVNGDLGVPRAIGDKPFLPSISARGKSVFEIHPKQGYTIHLCDGVTDVMTNEEIGHLVMNRLKKGDSLAAAAKALVEYAYARGSQDNLSVMIVDLSKNYETLDPGVA